MCIWCVGYHARSQSLLSWNMSKSKHPNGPNQQLTAARHSRGSRATEHFRLVNQTLIRSSTMSVASRPIMRSNHFKMSSANCAVGMNSNLMSDMRGIKRPALQASRDVMRGSIPGPKGPGWKMFRPLGPHDRGKSISKRVHPRCVDTYGLTAFGVVVSPVNDTAMSRTPSPWHPAP